jgi:coenzyme F420-reducing hydrogenase alpha subunit
MKEKSGKGKRTRTIRVDQIARVEGEGGLTLKIKGTDLQSVELAIFEPPRFFEALLRGRCYSEVPDITSRICGICPVAYQMSSCQAIEDVCKVVIPPEIKALRRLLYCGEWIESHTLHVYMLHAPDFLGFENAIEMAKVFPKEVERGLQLKKAGNEIMRLLGGREIHPINVRVGGFYRLPRPEELEKLLGQLERAREMASETVHWVAGFAFPEYDSRYELVSLRSSSEYPMNDGRVASTEGLDISVTEFDRHFTEQQVPYSTALHCLKNGRNYSVGPMARFALNFEVLNPDVRVAARAVGIGPDCRNPYRNIIIRSLEVLQACDEAARIIEIYKPPGAPAIDVQPLPGEGFGCTEAPRGILYHRYRIAENGDILEASIVPPTSQNQPSIEEDIRRTVGRVIERPKSEIKLHCEKVIRSHDPCISCSAHFLNLEIESV